MKRLGLLCFSLIFTPHLFANETQCYIPNQKNINDFFRAEDRWIEVKSENSKELETNKTLEIHIDFNTPWKSQFFKDKKSMGTISSLCLEKNNKTLHIVGGNRKITLTKLPNGAIESKITFIGFSFVYYYRPNIEVLNKERNIANDMLEWTNLPQ